MTFAGFSVAFEDNCNYKTAQNTCEWLRRCLSVYLCLLVFVHQTAPPSPGIHSLWTDPPPPEAVGTPGTLAQYFDLHDVKESSYHTFISRLDLHICNDSSSDSGTEFSSLFPPRGIKSHRKCKFAKITNPYVIPNTFFFLLVWKTKWDI